MKPELVVFDEKTTQELTDAKLKAKDAKASEFNIDDWKS